MPYYQAPQHNVVRSAALSILVTDPMSTIASEHKDAGTAARRNYYPQRTPRFWHGMRFCAAVRLLAKNRFRIHPFRWGMTFMVLLCSAISSTLYLIVKLLHGRRIDQTNISEPPIFIIGHWRSGTTLLHELLIRDPRFAYPTTYECFAANHFVVSEWILPRMFWFLLPPKRPMDNMSAGFDRPQEEEIALCALGAPTPYLRMAFPNHPPPYSEFYDMEGVNANDLQRFKHLLTWFVKALTYYKKKRIVLKSPPNTGRIAVLADIFPGTKFIHCVRDPCALFPSTRRTWEALDHAQGFQLPNHEDLDEYIFDTLPRMYGGFESQRSSVDPTSICDVRYEDLAHDPVGQLQMVYEKLDIGGFENVRAQIEEYVESQKDYQPNRHELDPDTKAEILRRWSDYGLKYGYCEPGDA